MQNNAYPKCSLSSCGKTEIRHTTLIELEVVAESETVIQPHGTVLMPIKIKRPENTLPKNTKHCLWDLCLEAKVSADLEVHCVRQPIRPCQFNKLTLQNNSSSAVIINPGRILAIISNRSQLSFANLRKEYNRTNKPVKFNVPKKNTRSIQSKIVVPLN